jgi:hypothetical protein
MEHSSDMLKHGTVSTFSNSVMLRGVVNSEFVFGSSFLEISLKLI